jgi:hypothetical protein
VDKIKERIKLQTELLKFLGVLFLALAGGTASLVVIPPPSTYQVLLALLGLALSVLVAVAATILYGRIDAEIDTL